MKEVKGTIKSWSVYLFNGKAVVTGQIDGDYICTSPIVELRLNQDQTIGYVETHNSFYHLEDIQK